MSWFRVEGKSAFHAKILKAGNEAYGAWVRMGASTCEDLLDGFVPEATAMLIAGRQEVLDRLLTAKVRPDGLGLLERVEGGFQLHDYHDYNPYADQERARRDELSKKRAEAGRRGAQSRWGSRTMASDMANGKQKDASVSDPDLRRSSDPKKGKEWQVPSGLPSDTPPSEKPRRQRKRGLEVALPETWKPIQGHWNQGHDLGFDDDKIASEAEKFRNHAATHGRLCVDWNAAFRSWLDKAYEFQHGHPPPRADARAPQGDLPFQNPETPLPGAPEPPPQPRVKPAIQAAIERSMANATPPQGGQAGPLFARIGRAASAPAETGGR